jgi:hypothetical protein
MFQEVKGEALEGSAPIHVTIKNGKIMGNKLEFTLERSERAILNFEGRVTGHSMEGYVTIEGKPDFKEKWKARRNPSTFKPIAK